MPSFESQKKNVATKLATPKIMAKMPAAITRLRSGLPKFSSLVAALLRLPRTLQPKANIVVARKTNPYSGLSNGHWREKYVLNRLSSETMRKVLIMKVIKWDTPSKKKKLDVLTVITIMTQLEAATMSSVIMLRTRMTLRTM